MQVAGDAANDDAANAGDTAAGATVYTMQVDTAGDAANAATAGDAATDAGVTAAGATVDTAAGATVDTMQVAAAGAAANAATANVDTDADGRIYKRSRRLCNANLNY